MVAVKDNRMVIVERMLDMAADVNAAAKVCPLSVSDVYIMCCFLYYLIFAYINVELYENIAFWSLLFVFTYLAYLDKNITSRLWQRRSAGLSRLG